jgi:hypothetical protein
VIIFYDGTLLRTGAGALSASKDALFAARAAVEAEELAQAAKAAADSEERRPQKSHSRQL